MCLSGRPESFDPRGLLCDPHEPGGLFPIRKSQDAAVGELVRMLKKAPPLRQDFSTSVCLSQDKMSSSSLQEQQASASIASSGLVASKTTADALEELRGYKEMKKDLLLSQAGRSNTSANDTCMQKSTTG
ncbi:autophagy-related protein 13b-like [Hevea brasiliensis]|uniref:autophagy-related protein 13b-like n=1 Tax=Hevea brasiliensis TaxID=3981 RepID=UPI002601001A|nr:autophagy-related protein 13b-like [Hevea brasiliensis]